MSTPLPTNGEEYSRFVTDLNNTGVVHDAAQWESLLKTPGHPLSAIKPEVMQAFTKTLIFKDGGLAHAEYDMLADSLTYTQFERVWSYFGVSMIYFAGTKDFYCCGHRDCCFRKGSFCSSVC